MGNTEVNIYLEIFGYIGTALVIISMMMTSMFRFRVINICGGIISAIYSVFYGAWAVVVMNICLIAVNIFHIIRELYLKRQEKKGNAQSEPPKAEQ